MTGDQVYGLIKLALILAFGAFVLYGLYRLVISDSRPPKDDD